MPKILIHGGVPLRGLVRVEASKNAILPMLAASLLVDGEVVFREVPWLDDVDVLVRLLSRLGVETRRLASGGLLLDARPARPEPAPFYLAQRMRASFLLTGPMVARFRRAEVPLPGGCAIGARPVDLHLKGLQALGAEVRMVRGEVVVEADRLVGQDVYLDFPSVGATENILMAATLAEGVTRIHNAACEPEVEDLANFLCAMGARIRGQGTSDLIVEGVPRLSGGHYDVIPDRIEAGTYLMAAAITGGDVTVEHLAVRHLGAVLAKLSEAGCELEVEGERVRLRRTAPLRSLQVTTMPYPGFPTDLQAPIMALCTLAGGISVIRETIFENRFRHAMELERLGAHIRVEGRTALVEGVPKLTGAPVEATDLRAGAALVLAGLAAEGTTEVLEAQHLDRGYYHLERKLAFLGADIERVEDFVEVL